LDETGRSVWRRIDIYPEEEVGIGGQKGEGG
jgi:hypothetical protein